jgi:hypothetical protein
MSAPLPERLQILIAEAPGSGHDLREKYVRMQRFTPCSLF